MKKRKLNLNSLKVKSFVTLDTPTELKNLNGGRAPLPVGNPLPARGTHYEWCEN